MDLTLDNGHDKTGLDQARAEIAAQIRRRHDQLAQADHGRQTRREIDAKLAAEGRCSVAHVQRARRLVRKGEENLVIAVMLGALPLTTAARAGVPRKRNTVYEARDRLVATLVGGA